MGVAATAYHFVPCFGKLYCTLHAWKEPLGTKRIKEANSFEQPQDVSCNHRTDNGYSTLIHTLLKGLASATVIQPM